MAEIKVYRSYDHYRDPVMDEVKDIVDKEKLAKRLGVLAEITGVSRQTYRNWFDGVTRYPRYATVMATIGALGYRQAGFRQVEKFDVDEAREVAAKWKAKQATKKANAKAALIAKRKAARAAAPTGAAYHRS